MPEPFGYGFYTQLLRLRTGEKTVALSPELYERDPLKAFELALGLGAKPRGAVGATRKRGQVAREAAELTEKRLREQRGF